MADEISTGAPEAPAPPPGLRAWWRLMEFRIGVIPAPVFLVLIALVAGFVAADKVPSDILMNIAMLSLGGFACAEIGKRIPLIRQMGAAAIFATFVPSYLVFSHILPDPVVASITEFTKASNFLYLFIAAIIVGSIFGMDRRVLVSGFLKIFAPLALGSVVAGLVGMGVGTALGLDPKHTLFFVIIPIMAGGVGEGAIPLSVGYGQILHMASGDLLAELLPAVMFGSLTAILLSGGLNLLGKRLPHLTGEGQLTIGEHDVPLASEAEVHVAPASATIAAAGITAVCLYLTGALAQKLLGWPGPVTMLFLAVLLKLGRAIPPSLEQGAFAVYQFFRTAVTYPLLFAIGVAMTPWEKLMAAISFANVATIVATVSALMTTGFVTARFIGMYPIDVAIVTACHSGQGGTGDVAILTASNRMQLMPFAQIATRIGGAVTVTLALIALTRFPGL
ncbi:MAG TPA: 2-hydroxycarboxylate transporter family protein [Phenylobacterium sp.]|nr:2-hydroxycarboxylate transporter family protein [Phenylobacterium sp.]